MQVCLLKYAKRNDILAFCSIFNILLFSLTDDPEEPEDKIVDPNPDFSCQSNFGRFDHRNCDYYYHCRDRRPTVRECRRGKYYDRHSRKCKDSIDVDCENRIRPEGK